MHSGTLSAASEAEGQGASFMMSIPVVDVQTALLTIVDSTAGATRNSKSGTQLPSLSGLRILAVDDEVDTRDMIRAVLEEVGANVLTVGSAKEALEALPGWKPDVLICISECQPKTAIR